MRSGFIAGLPISLVVVLLVGAGVAAPTGASDRGVHPTAPGTGGSPALASSPLTAATNPSSVEVAPAYAPVPGVSAVGPLSADTRLDVAVGLPSRDPGGLAAFVAAASVPGTPAYRNFLSAGAAQERFGASAGTLTAAQTYFRGFGLEATANPDGLLLFVTGPAGRLATAFGTTFEEYRTDSGRTFVSHPTAATLPGALGTNGVFGLGNVTPLDPAAIAAPATSTVPNGACAGPPGGLSPCAIADAYDIAPLEANGTNGSGVRIGVVDAYSAAENQSGLSSDLASFSAETSIPVGTVNYVYPVPTTIDLNASGTNSAWALEDALDLEWARASAPGATIDMTFSPDPSAGIYEAVDWLVSEDAVNVVSMSWGEPDTGVFNAFNQPCSAECNATTDGSYEILGPVLELGAAEGISFFAASGDCGAADGTSGDSTNFPASDPYVTGVGGTNLMVGAGNVWAGETAWSGNATGATSPGCNNQGGSGGGYAPSPEPWWQFGITDPARGRGVPDVAIDAQNPVAIVIAGGSGGVEGTSVGTPIWAGIAALADQYAGTDLGLLNPGLYKILGGANYSTDFHDITQGTNGYSAGVGWDPVTGIGSPIVGALIPALIRGGGLAGQHLAASVFATPRAGPAPLRVSFALTASGGRGIYPLEGISFGDGESALTNGTVVVHTFPTAGDYLAQSFIADEAGNESTSLPVLIAVGGGPLNVNLTVSNDVPAVGGSVTLRATASGGTAPYSYRFYFGDGGFTPPGTPSVVHAYQVPGSFCAEVVATDSAEPSDAGAGSRVAVTVGGGSLLDCSDSLIPFTVTPNGTAPVRDAPADYGSSLFKTVGGANPPDGLLPSASLTSNDAYVAACACAIFRHAGNYSVTEWAEDTVDESANATTNVTVAPALDVTFGASTLSGPAPLEVQFVSSVRGGYEASAAATQWSFGDGTTAVGDLVNATYSTPGEYLAIGLLSDQGRGNGSEAFLIDVQPSLSAAPLGVTGTITPATNLSSGTSVRLTATPVGPAALTSNTLLAWDLGDGHSAFGGDVTETYFSGTSAATVNNTLAGTVTVESSYFEPALAAGFDLPNFFAVEAGGFVPRADALEATATVSPAEDVVPFSVLGDASATGPAPVSLTWLYGDGTTGTGTPVNHTFRAAQGYTVETVANDTWGDTATLSSAVAANGPLGISGSPTLSDGPAPLTVTINATAYGGAGPPYQYEWTLTGGRHSNGSSVTLVFPIVGTYVLRLNVTDRSGGTAERNFTIMVDYPWPLAPIEIVAAGAAVGLLFAVVLAGTRGRQKRDPEGEPWPDPPRSGSDGAPVR